MPFGLSVGILLVVGVILYVGGLVNGTAGFGYGMVSMAALTAVFDPQSAAVLMIVPVIAAEADLLGELGREGLRRCSRRFWPFLLAAAVGTLIGMILLPWIPAAALTTVIGLLVVMYVLFRQGIVSVSSPDVRQITGYSPRSDTLFMAGAGFIGGVVFGSVSLGVVMISYLDGFDLDRSTFVGVVAMIFLGISTLRVGAAVTLGLYGSQSLLWLSIAAAGPGLLGVATGKRIRHVLPSRHVEIGVYLLLMGSGLQLIAEGSGIL